MNYQSVYEYVRDITQNLGLSVQFFHGRKEILNLTTSTKPVYAWMLPLTANGTVNVNFNPQTVWQLNIIFYKRDEVNSAIDQNDPTVLQDEMKTLALTSDIVDRFLRTFIENDINDELESASNLLTVQNYSIGNAIKDTASLLTGTTLTINFLVSDTFDYCCGIVRQLLAPTILITGSDSTSITLSLTNNDENADTICIERTELSYGYTTIAELDASETSYTAVNLDSDTDYSFRALVKSNSPMFTDSDYSSVVSGTTSSAFDPDAEAWFDRMTAPTDAQKTALNTFVVTLKADGNFALLYEYFAHFLGSTNGLIGMKSKSATANGGLTFGANGCTGNAVNGYIDYNFNPNTEGTLQNDYLNGGYVYAVTPAAFMALYGVGISNINTDGLYSLASGQRLRVNSANASFTEIAVQLSDKTQVISRRTGSTTLNLYNDGVSVGTSSVSSNGVPNGNDYGLALNLSNSDILHSDATLSSRFYAQASGFDISAFYTAEVQLLTDLGILP